LQNSKISYGAKAPFLCLEIESADSEESVKKTLVENTVGTLWTTSASTERNRLKITEKSTVLLKCARKAKTEGSVLDIHSFSFFCLKSERTHR